MEPELLEWTETVGAKRIWKRMHGHYMVVITHDGKEWEKWIDGHWRGIETNITRAMEQLEREARGEGTAWETHK